MRVVSRLLRPACVGLALSGAALVAEEVADSPEYIKAKDELRALESSRDLDKFQLDFAPLRFDRIVLNRKGSEPRTFHYLTFRLRNRIIDDADVLLQSHAGFAAVMKTIEEQFAGVAKFTTEGGPRLFTEVTALPEDQRHLATIVETEQYKDRERSVNITAAVYDENGTRFDLFDPPASALPNAEDADAVAAWVNDALNFTARDKHSFEAHGNSRAGNVYHEVRDLIEEREGMRLLSVHQIRQKRMPTYRPGKVDAEGVAEGEAFGVLIFDDLPAEGDRFELRIQGLSNKTRFGNFMPDQAAPDPRDKVQDYVNARIRRRTFVITYDRPGDEYFRDQDRFVVRDQGWRWVDAMVRLRHRSTMAYSKYFLDNHPLDTEASENDASGKPAPLLRNKEVEAAFTEYLAGTHQELAALYDEELARTETARAAMKSRYAVLREGERIDQEALARREAAWNAAYDERAAQLSAGKGKSEDGVRLHSTAGGPTWAESLQKALTDEAVTGGQ